MEEFEEEEFLEFLRGIQEQQNRQGVIHVLNQSRMREMNSSFKKVSGLLSEFEANAKVECGIDDLSKAGYISIHFNDAFHTTDLVKFAECLRPASNAEINVAFEKLNIDMMFYGVFQTELMH